jgi:predicted DCC family thiol-disulfide oxidoreductase YuxK
VGVGSFLRPSANIFNMHNQPSGTLVPQILMYDIFLDGSCSFCRWTRAWIEPYDSRGRLRFLDYNDPSIGGQTPYSRAELESEMRVRTPDGIWLTGFEAWLAVLCALPRLAWIGRLANLKPFRRVGPSIYRFVARHRYWIPGVPARCTNGACALPKQDHR